MDEQPKSAARRTTKASATKATATKATAKKTTTKKATTKKTTAKKTSAKKTSAATRTAPSTTDVIVQGSATKPRTPRVRAPRATPVPPPAVREIPRPAPVGRSKQVDAVARYGPDARDWVARTRDRYPAAGPAAVARLATTQRRPRAWLVLAVAAAFGVDPTDPARVRDLVELKLHSGRKTLEARARARYSQDT